MPRVTEKFSYWMLVLPALAIMVIFYIVPVLGIWKIAFTEPVTGFGNFEKMAASSAVQTSFIITFRVAAVTTVGCLLLGYIVAYAISNYASRLTPLMVALVILPFWVSVLIRSFSWIVLLGRSGIVNDALRDAGLIEAPLKLMHNEFGVVIAMIHVMLPFAVLPMLTNMRGISGAYVQAARSLGASEWYAFRNVYFPQTMPGVMSGALLVFVLSLGFYVTPALLGGGRVLMISEYITYQIQEFLNWGLGSALSVALLVATALVLLVAARFVNLRATLLDRKIMARSTFQIFFQTGAWMIIAFLVLPILVVIPISLTDTSYIGLPKEALSLQHYANYFSDGDWLGATWTSIWVGLVVASCATVLGTAFAIGCWFLSDRAAMVARWVLITPILVPPVVQALGFYRFWVVLGLIDTHFGVILAHTLLALPYVSISVFASLTNLDRNIPRAARSLGASVLQTVRAVIVPAIKPGILSGFIFAFIVSFDEIVGVLFITVRRVQTLPKMIWEGIQDNIDPTIAAVATLLVLLTLLATLFGALRRS